MNKEEMNRAIAEACGWKLGICGSSHVDGRFLDFQTGGPYPTLDYTSCLNAMASAEATLDHEMWGQYADELACAVHGKPSDNKYSEDITVNMVMATAQQRATAFLRTLNLYQDTRES